MFALVLSNKYGRTAFRSVMNYIAAAGNEEKTYFMGTLNLHSDTLAGQILEMESISQDNLRCVNPLHHSVISWPEGEVPSYEQCADAARTYLEEMLMPDCACLWGLHRNTKSYHIHMCINKTDPVTYRTIAPGGGWTKKTCERISRILEVKQGWRRFTGRFWDVDGNGTITEKVCAVEPLRSNPLSASGIERRYGTKSAITAASEKAAIFLYGDTSWQELHEHLAGCNMRLERSKKGLVLHVGDRTIRASSISHDLSKKKLEARLGPWEEPLYKPELAPLKQEPVDARYVELLEYLRLRSAHNAERAALISDLRKRQKEAVMSMKDRHKEERKRYESIPYLRRPVDYMERKRALLARQHRELKELRDEQIGERAHMRSEHKVFPSYDAWLKENGMQDRIIRWAYHVSSDGVLTGGKSAVARPYPIPGFDGHSEYQNGSWSVCYTGPDGTARFRDYGNRIVIYDWKERDATVAAMRIACTRWGKADISGSREFTELAADISASCGLTLKDGTPAKRAALIAARSKSEEERARKENEPATEAFDAYHKAVGADRYLLAVHVPPQDSGAPERRYTLGSRCFGAPAGYLPGEIIPRLSSLKKAESEKGADVRITPLSDRLFHILLTLTSKGLSLLTSAGVRANACVQTASDAFCAVVTVPKCSGSLAARACLRLAARLAGICGCTEEAVASSHPAPGFHTPGVEMEAAVVRTGDGICRKAAEFLEEELRKCAQQHELEQAEAFKACAPTKAAASAREAFMLHARMLLAKNGECVNYSAIDGRIALRLAVTGHSQDEIYDALRTQAPLIRPEDRRDEHDWEDSARRIADFLETPAGLTLRTMHGPLREMYLRTEGRWTQEDERSKIYDATPDKSYTGLVMTPPDDGSFMLETEVENRRVRVYVPGCAFAIGDRAKVSYGADAAAGGIAERLPSAPEKIEKRRKESLEKRPNVSVYTGTVTDVDNSARTFTTVSEPEKGCRPRILMHYLTRLKGEAPRVGDVVDVEYTKGSPTFEVKFVKRAIPKETTPVRPSPGYKVTDALVVAVNEDTYVTQEERTGLRVEHQRNWKYISVGDRVSLTYADDITRPSFMKVRWAKPYSNLTVTDIDRENSTFVTVSEDGEILTHSMADFRYRDRLEVGHRVSISFPDNNPRYYGSIFDITTWEEYKKRSARENAEKKKAATERNAEVPSATSSAAHNHAVQVPDPSPATAQEAASTATAESTQEHAVSTPEDEHVTAHPAPDVPEGQEGVQSGHEVRPETRRYDNLRVTGIDREDDTFTAVDANGNFSTHNMEGFRWKSRLDVGHLVSVTYPGGNANGRASIRDHTAYEMYAAPKKDVVQRNPYAGLVVTEIDRTANTFTAVDGNGASSVHGMSGYRWKDSLAVGHVVSVKYPGNDISQEGSIFNQTTYDESRKRRAEKNPRNPYNNLTVTSIDREFDTFTAVDRDGNPSVHSMAGYRYKDWLETGHEVSVKYPDNDISCEGSIFNRTTYNDYRRRSAVSSPAPCSPESKNDLDEYMKEDVARLTARSWVSYCGQTRKLDAEHTGICFINQLGSRVVATVTTSSLARALGRDVNGISNGETVDLRIGDMPGEVAGAKAIVRSNGLGL